MRRCNKKSHCCNKIAIFYLKYLDYVFNLAAEVIKRYITTVTTENSQNGMKKPFSVMTSAQRLKKFFEIPTCNMSLTLSAALLNTRNGKVHFLNERLEEKIEMALGVYNRFFQQKQETMDDLTKFALNIL